MGSEDYRRGTPLMSADMLPNPGMLDIIHAHQVLNAEFFHMSGMALRPPQEELPLVLDKIPFRPEQNYAMRFSLDALWVICADIPSSN